MGECISELSADLSGGQAVRTTDAQGRPVLSLAADHTSADARIDTLLQAAERRIPIVLIAGEGYALLPWHLGCAYAILGWCVSYEVWLMQGTGYRRLGTRPNRSGSASSRRARSGSSASRCGSTGLRAKGSRGGCRRVREGRAGSRGRVERSQRLRMLVKH